MPSIIDPNKIDTVGQMPDGTVLLAVAEVEPWTGVEDQLLVLSKKLKCYTQFALDGQLLKLYPQVKGQKIEVVLHYSQDLPLTISTLLKKANQVYGTPSLTFTSRLIDNTDKR